MPFILPDLNATTRQLMLEEFESDFAANRVYVSARALPGTGSAYVDAQRDAFSGGDTDSLSAALAGSGIFATHQNDGKAVNVAAAAAALGDGQFIAYYVRAVCRRAIDEGREVEIYRGQSTAEHRAESEAAIGTRRDPSDLLDEFRSASLEPWKFSVGKVNSGLAVKLV
jgi:hypothetical protein